MEKIIYSINRKTELKAMGIDEGKRFDIYQTERKTRILVDESIVITKVYDNIFTYAKASNPNGKQKSININDALIGMYEFVSIED